MNSTHVPIVSIEPIAPPTKDGKSYRYEVAYVLEDGQRIETSLSRRLLREAKSQYAALPHAPSNPMAAMFHDGQFVGTQTSYYIGPR